MQVKCSKCSAPIALSDIIELHYGRLAHVDCRRPHTLTLEERALLFVYCSDHASAHCLGCDVRFRMVDLAADPLMGRTDVCPRCRRDLAESARAHLYSCVALPAEIRRRAREVREAARHLVKQSQQLRDKADVLVTEAEATLLEGQRALREVLRGGLPPRPER